MFYSPMRAASRQSSISPEVLAEAFEIICRSRYAARKFSPKGVSNEVIRKTIELTQLAPSSLNLQPYKIIVVQSDESKTKLSIAMLGSNKKKVLSAPFSVVFAADKDPAQLTRQLMDLERRSGKDAEYVSTLPSKINFLLGSGILSTTLRRLATHIVSPIKAAPSISSTNEAWSMKNTTLAAQQFMLAATSVGLCTAPMEGFDGRRVCFQLGIPIERYCIPIVISAGYSEEHVDNGGASYELGSNTNGNSNDTKLQSTCEFEKKVRFALEEICYGDQFGSPLSNADTEHC